MELPLQVNEETRKTCKSFVKLRFQMTERKDFKVELEHHKIMSRASQLNDPAFSYKMKPTIETAYETYYKPNLGIKYTSHHKVVSTQ